jgi:hypothetical protein
MHLFRIAETQSKLALCLFGQVLAGKNQNAVLQEVGMDRLPKIVRQVCKVQLCYDCA